MKELIIVGAGNAARVILQFAIDINKVKATWKIKGFIADSGLDINGLTNGDYDIIGTVDEWQPSENEVYCCAIGNGAVRKILVEKLKARGAHFIQMIHPTALISDYCEIGEGVIINPYAYVQANAKVGDFVYMMSGIAHDVTVGDYTTISGHCCIAGDVNIGAHVQLGSSATLIPKISVGDGAIVGAGSVVTRDVEGDVTVFGNPARVLKKKL